MKKYAQVFSLASHGFTPSSGRCISFKRPGGNDQQPTPTLPENPNGHFLQEREDLVSRVLSLGLRCQ